MAVRRISIGPGEIAGYFSRLKTGFDELGVPCEHFALTSNNMAYQQSRYFLQDKFLVAAKLQAKKNGAIRVIGRLMLLGVNIAVFVQAVLRCDVFIFSGTTSFFRFYELPLLKLLGKRILVTYLGSDARPPIFSGRHLDDMGAYVNPASAFKETVRLVKRIRLVERYADVIINHTATAQLFSRAFVRHLAIGMPITSAATPLPASSKESTAIRILHAPSRPLAKGSEIFRKILEDLRAEGYLIDFIELIGVPNSVVMRELQLCDFVVDELYSDVPMAMLATEAAIFGKPVVVGGYYAEQCKVDNPDFDASVSLYVEPNQIKNAIRRMIDDHDFRLTLGRRAQSFVKDNWNPSTVAKNYLLLIDNNIPAHWTCSPTVLPYCWGWGLSKDIWRRQVCEYVSGCGDDALMLNHNSALKSGVLNEIQRHQDGCQV